MNGNLARRIYIDTNVFVGYYRKLKHDVAAISLLFSLKDYELFTSTLAICQTISIIQGRKCDEARRAIIVNFINHLLAKVKIINISESDIREAMTLPNIDLEDNIQFVSGKKGRCYTYVTNNKKDFKQYFNITVVEPKHIRNILTRA